MSNPIKYSSRDYNSIIADINADPELIDKPEWWKRIWGGVGDVLALYEDLIANEGYLRTAFTRRAVRDLCQLIDYEIGEHSTSDGTLIFELNADTVAWPKTIALADAVAQSPGSQTQSSKRFEARAALVQALTAEAFTTNFAANNELTVARVYMTGEKVRVSTTNTLPSPLVAGTDYWVIYVSATTIKLATSRLNAYNGVEITLLSDGVGVHTITLYSIQGTCYQQTSVASVSVGESDGITEWQTFDLPDKYILSDTLGVTINAVSWSEVATLVDSLAADTDFKLYFNDDYSSFLQFGNGVYGAIPGNFDVFVAYAYGGGADSNVSTLNRITSYAGTDSDVTGVSNGTTFTGASDHETISEAKRLAPLLLKARSRFVTFDDGLALTLAYAGVSQAFVVRNAYGPLSCAIPIVPSGGGFPGVALKTALQAYLISISVLESVDARVLDPTYNTTVGVTLTVHMKTGYAWDDIKKYIYFAVHLLFSEVGQELQNLYLEDGIGDAVTYINTKWGILPGIGSFTAVDYAQLTRILDNFTPAAFGQDFQESDIAGFIDSFITGVDYCIPTAGLPLVCTDYEITKDDLDAVANITEI